MIKYQMENIFLPFEEPVLISCSNLSLEIFREANIEIAKAPKGNNKFDTR